MKAVWEQFLLNRTRPAYLTPPHYTAEGKPRPGAKATGRPKGKGKGKGKGKAAATTGSKAGEGGEEGRPRKRVRRGSDAAAAPAVQGGDGPPQPPGHARGGV